MERLIISAPFGNSSLFNRWKCTIPTVGTFTREYRGSFLYRMWRMALTVRWYPGIGAYKNKLGLPNPGEKGLQYISFPKRSIISISARKTEDWGILANYAMRLEPLAIELNLSCPNCNDPDTTDYPQVFRHCAGYRQQLFIVKLPPLQFEQYANFAHFSGLNAYHCCNTIPIAGGRGGLSGKPLMPFSLNCIRYVKKSYGKENTILIGGGGITCLDDVKQYKDAGATHFAVASCLLNPFNWRSIRELAERLNDDEVSGTALGTIAGVNAGDGSQHRSCS